MSSAPGTAAQIGNYFRYWLILLQILCARFHIYQKELRRSVFSAAQSRITKLSLELVDLIQVREKS